MVRELIDEVCRAASWNTDPDGPDRLAAALDAQTVSIVAGGARLEAWVAEDLSIRVRLSAARWSPEAREAVRMVLASSRSLLAKLVLRSWSELFDAAGRVG
jgi:hypothetical protein